MVLLAGPRETKRLFRGAVYGGKGEGSMQGRVSTERGNSGGFVKGGMRRHETSNRKQATESTHPLRPGNCPKKAASG